MAGSNRAPAPIRGQVPPGWGTPEADQQRAPAQQGQAHDDPMLRWPQRGAPTAPPMGHPQSHAADPYAGYARDPYSRPQAQPPGYDYSQDPAHGHNPSGYDPHSMPHQSHPQGHGYPQQGHAPAGYGQPPQHDDRQSWDLSHYSAHGSGASGFGASPNVPPPVFEPNAYQPRTDHGAYAPAPAAGGGHDWRGAPQDHAYSLDQYGGQHPQGHGQNGYGQPGYDGYADPQAQHDPHHQGYEQDPAYDPALDPEEIAEPKGPRPLMVIAALVGAIAVGGGLAYGYRMLGGGKAPAKPPVVKAEVAPAKVKPADAGGKEFAHTDKKFVNRLGEQPAAAGQPQQQTTAAPPPAEPEAPRKVTTLIVNKDGTITPQVTQAPPSAPATAAPVQAVAPPPPPPASGAVPGMVVEGLPARPTPRAQAEPPVTAVAKAAPPVADLPLPKARTQPVEPKAEAPAPKKKPSPRDDLLAKAEAAPAAPQAAGGTVIGYVPVLASKRSREEALKSYADLAQKYPDVLAGKVPDVVEANIPDKGVWFRNVVGPPGSREAAREICSKLDAQGFKGCWVTAYRQ